MAVYTANVLANLDEGEIGFHHSDSHHEARLRVTVSIRPVCFQGKSQIYGECRSSVAHTLECTDLNS
jgi:hypothetical protein